VGLVTPQKPHPAVPTHREAEAAGVTSNVDVDLQLLGDLAVGDSPPDATLPDSYLPEARLDSCLVEE